MSDLLFEEATRLELYFK